METSVLKQNLDHSLIDLVSKHRSQLISEDQFLNSLESLYTVDGSDSLQDDTILKVCQDFMSCENSEFADFTFGKFVSSLFQKQPQLSLWEKLMRTNIKHAVMLNFLENVLKSSNHSSAQLIPGLFSDQVLKNLLSLSGQKNYWKIGQILHIFEHFCQMSEKEASDEILKHFDKSWVHIRNIICQCFSGENTKCTLKRKALGFLCTLSNSALHNLCFKTGSYQTLSSLAIKLWDLCPNIGKGELCESSHWFGSNHLVNSSLASNMRKSFVILLLQSASALILAKDQQFSGETSDYSTISDALLPAVLRFFGSSEKLVSAFVENDEHLLGLILTSCIIWPKICDSEGSSLICPFHLWVIIMHSVSWDETVVLDWLTSESMALFALVYCLKLFRNHWDEFKTAVSDDISVPFAVDQRKTIKRCTGSNYALKIKVTEDLGGVSTNRMVKLCGNTTTLIDTSQEKDNAEISITPNASSAKTKGILVLYCIYSREWTLVSIVSSGQQVPDVYSP